MPTVTTSARAGRAAGAAGVGWGAAGGGGAVAISGGGAVAAGAHAASSAMASSRLAARPTTGPGGNVNAPPRRKRQRLTVGVAVLRRGLELLEARSEIRPEHLE